jgi:hypothetical protein
VLVSDAALRRLARRLRGVARSGGSDRTLVRSDFCCCSVLTANLALANILAAALAAASVPADADRTELGFARLEAVG